MSADIWVWVAINVVQHFSRAKRALEWRFAVSLKTWTSAVALLGPNSVVAAVLGAGVTAAIFSVVYKSILRGSRVDL